MNTSNDSWSNANFWIESTNLNGKVSDYETHYVPVVIGDTYASASSTSSCHGTHVTEVRVGNTIKTDIDNITSFWFRAAEASDIQVSFKKPVPFANGHELRLSHIAIGANPALSKNGCECFVFHNRNTGAVFGALGHFNPSTRELRLEEVHADVNQLWKPLTQTFIRNVVDDAEKSYVKSTLNKSLSPLQRVVDLSFGVSLALAIGGWFYKPALGIAGIVCVIVSRVISRSMGTTMSEMKSWIASKVEVVPQLQACLEKAFSNALVPRN